MARSRNPITVAVFMDAKSFRAASTVISGVLPNSARRENVQPRIYLALSEIIPLRVQLSHLIWLHVWNNLVKFVKTLGSINAEEHPHRYDEESGGAKRRAHSPIWIARKKQDTLK